MDIPDTGANRISKRGFGSMSPERRREIARLGGIAVPPEKRTFALDTDLAREAGRKGGVLSRRPAKETPDVR